MQRTAVYCVFSLVGQSHKKSERCIDMWRGGRETGVAGCFAFVFICLFVCFSLTTEIIWDTPFEEKDNDAKWS